MLVHFDVLQDLGSEVVFWFVAQVHDHSTLPIPLRSYCAILVVRFDVPHDLGSGVVSWFVVGHVRGRTPLPVPLRSC